MKDYSRGRHTVFYHRYHLVWITKYRYRVMNHEVKKRVRKLVAQVAEEIGVNTLPPKGGSFGERLKPALQAQARKDYRPRRLKNLLNRLHESYRQYRISGSQYRLL